MKRLGVVLLGLFGLVVAAAAAGVWVFLHHPLAVHAALGRRALSRAGLEKTELATPAGKLRYWRGGKGPAVVLLHGAGDQAGTWSIVVPLLLPRHTLLVPDLPGHGESAPARGALSVGTIVEGLEALLAKEGNAGPFTLVGNSLGAWVACLAASRQPTRVARLVLVNGGPLRGERHGISLSPKDRAEARKLVEAMRDPASPRVPNFVLEDLVKAGRSGPIARLSATATDMERWLMDGKMASLKPPVVLLWGESDRIMPVSYARRIQAELPSARLVTIPACGHVPQQECPYRFGTELAKLLAESP